MNKVEFNRPDYNIEELTSLIKDKACEFGFLEAKIANIIIDSNTQSNFLNWLNKSFYGDMDYLARNTELRFNPALLHNNTLSIICVKAPYLTTSIDYHKSRLQDSKLTYISNYALGRDYHKVLKKQLKNYAKAINEIIQDKIIKNGNNIVKDFTYRAFTDSAPILEVELAKNSGLGFRGKNTLLINNKEGSFFFLGELFTNLPLKPDNPVNSNCGSCTKCLKVCPTQAFIEPYLIDARKCIAYLTIENKGSIPVEFRKAIGTRIYGCDDCQLFCPWNKFSKLTSLEEFTPINNLDKLSLIEAFKWSEEEWAEKVKGTPIYRIGYINWLRNVAVALGNSQTSVELIETLKSKANHESELVRKHVHWALLQHSSIDK